MNIELPSRSKQAGEARANNLTRGEFDKHPEGVGIVDIVAIHGLAGHHESTWTAKGRDGTLVNWLQDLLPKKVRNARIMSVSYNSGAQFSRYTSDVFVFAYQVLDRVIDARTTPQEMARPIIFICHGLGGVIFKQALNEAQENGLYASTILPRIVGVAFFGTPHGGSGIVHWSSMLNSMLEAGDIATTTTSQLAEDFELDSSILEHISESFVEHGEKLKIFSFYETEKMDFMVRKVVETEWATLDWPNETRAAINGNHRSMVWFTEMDDPRFEPVWMCINEMTSNAIYSKARYGPLQSANKLSSVLQISDYEEHKARNPTAAHGTCTWILNHVQYQTWLAATDSPLLRVSGDAGCGKSVLASFLVDYHKSKQESNVCYFFFKADNSEQRQASQGLSALLYQLCTSQPELIGSTPALLGEEGQALTDLVTLWQLITDATEDPKARPTICFVDGLDECEETSRQQLLNLISEYFAMATQEDKRESTTRKKLKLLVTSRPDNTIRNALNRCKTAPAARRNDDFRRIEVEKPRLAVLSLRGEAETDAINKDIKVVIKDAMEELGCLGQPIDILESIGEELTSSRGITFLWVTLIIALLKQGVAGRVSRSDLEDVVKSKRADAIYTVLLNSNAKQPSTQKMLSIILAALRPLTVEELGIAFAIRPDHETLGQAARPRRPSSMTFNDVEQELVGPFEDHIRGLCGPFVRIVDDRVYLVHQTARDFLLDPASSQEFDEPVFGMDESSGSGWLQTFTFTSVHTVLLEICVTYLYMLGKRSGIAGSLPGEPSEKTAAFLAYAATSWTTHFRRVRHTIRRRDIPYYEGLCHPFFPGSRRCLDVFGLSTAELVGSADQIQDHLVRILELEPEDRRARRRIRTTRDRLLEAQGSMYSSSVSMLGKSHFPVKVDENGFVCLDHRRYQAKKMV
ncbi:hypothetical protein EKO27_g6700 [Xylaria grammica]|uniref:NACHT domain-containing protein n=1 Tax=Xylaria grammica TaxID=363999 RepID=A0A439D1W5_9PEZI|nr:hypothetical protein EKO27_g6700 [Xylaria grammica]